MKVHNFFTEIAFIPWNFKRSSPETVRLLSDNPDYFALCLHGCNHTDNEFGGINYQELKDLSSTALWRMEQHNLITGLPYDPIMVFPHDRFSSIAMKALKDSGYFSVFCSTLQANDRGEPSAHEYQRPFTTIYYDFPLFYRRYPWNKSIFLQDIDLGRPILIVKHHHNFRNGYKETTDLIDWINSIGNIRWTSLLSIAEHYIGLRTHPTRQSANVLKTNLAFNGKVAIRRFLCEVRDNYIETSSLLTKVSKIVRGWIDSFGELYREIKDEWLTENKPLLLIAQTLGDKQIHSQIFRYILRSSISLSTGDKLRSCDLDLHLRYRRNVAIVDCVFR